MRFNLSSLGWLMVAVLVAATATANGPEFVFVSNPDDGAIYRIDPSVAWNPDDPQIPVLIFQERRFDIGDMVIAPDGRLFACAPSEGVVFALDPTTAPAGGFPYSLDDVEIIATTGINAPQCGWFSDKGDLFLTDRGSDTAVWIYQDLVPLSPEAPAPSLTELVAADGVFSGFAGQGVTQAAPGDLLFVDQANNTLGTLPFDPIFRFDAPTSTGPGTTGPTLDDPVGVARLGNGTVFVASGDAVISLGYAPCDDFTFDGETPHFLELTADDVLYVASTSKKAATLWAIDAASCAGPETVFSFSRPDFKPSLSGVAITQSSRQDANPVVATDPDYLFNFKDHAYELSFDPDVCTPNPIVATEVEPSCLAGLIDGGYIIDDDNDPLDAVSGVPVPYAGDGGVAQVYTLTGTCSPVDKTITHAISAYTALIGNPRIVRCEFPDGTDICNSPPAPCPPEDPRGCAPAYCELIKLESFFPFNGIFPEDARIAGTKSATTSDFSEYFLADVDIDGSGDSRPGCFCGWEDPLSNVDMIDPSDPFAGLPSYNPGSSVPLKFRVAALPVTGGSCNPDDPDYVDVCSGAPYGYVTGAEVLLSVAKVFNADGVEDFTPLVPSATSATTPGTIFGNPSSPSTPYHYNLDTSGFETGVYQAVAVALTDNFTVDWTYFAID